MARNTTIAEEPLARGAQRVWRIPTAAVAWTLFLVLVVLTLDSLFRERGGFDYDAMRRIGALDAPGLEPVLRFASALTGSFWAITLWGTLLCALLLAKRWLAATALAAFPIAGGINTIIRVVVGKPRPDTAELNLPWMTPDDIARTTANNDYVSFPSGHVAGAILLYGFVFLLAGEFRSRTLRIGTRIGCVSIVLLSGLSRIWLGAHWTGDVVAGYALGGLALLGVAVMYRTLEPTTRKVPLVRAAPVPHDHSVPHAHALTSTILFRGDEVTKIYNPGFVPRVIYWLSFQAPFAYAHNPDALRAAVARRNLARKLTEYWFGHPCVAAAIRAEQVDGRWAITGRFTEGSEPRDHARARAFLFELADRFDEAGLPTWQVDPRQPRSLGNILEAADGSYQVIDLESGLVSPLVSPRAWWRALRRSMVPMYDDVYFDLTRSYVVRHAGEMEARFGEGWLAQLQRQLVEAEDLATRWHSAEPRIWSRGLRWFWDGFGVLRVTRWIRRKAAAGRSRAENWIESSVESWESQGRITHAQAATLRESINAPEFQSVLPHFGVHLIIGVALRFPIGSIVRASYTSANLVVACLRFAIGNLDRAGWRRAVRIHSPLVILLAAMPGIGTFAYIASGPVRSNHLLVRVVFDSAGEKIPLHLYRRTGLRRIVCGRQEVQNT